MNNIGDDTTRKKFIEECYKFASNIAYKLTKLGFMMASAESCTGGLIASACTYLPGSSVWFERGLVTYSNESKAQLLGVDCNVIAKHGAVSEAVACAMAIGVCNKAPVQTSLAVTGIAGPSGASTDKPIGSVWFAWSISNAISIVDDLTKYNISAHHGFNIYSEYCLFNGDRTQIRYCATLHALKRMMQLLPI